MMCGCGKKSTTVSVHKPKFFDMSEVVKRSEPTFKWEVIDMFKKIGPGGKSEWHYLLRGVGFDAKAEWVAESDLIPYDDVPF